MSSILMDDNNIMDNNKIIDNNKIKDDNKIIKHICKVCNKIYSSYQSLWIHNKKFHNKNIKKNNDCNIIECILCSKKFKWRQNKYEHEKLCKEKNDKKNELEKLKNKIEQLENKINNKNNNINNGNINNGTINNIQIVALGREDLSKLTEKEQKNILKCGSASLKKIIADINFNPKFPEHQNIRLTNLAKKTCKQYDEKSKNFIEVSKDRLLCSLINFRTGDLIEIYEDFKENGNRYHDSVNYIINVVNNYQDNSDNKEFEKKYIELKKEIELLIYNKTKELQNNKTK